MHPEPHNRGPAFLTAMPFGWIRVTMPANFKAGRVPVSVTCGGQTVRSAFTVK